MGCVGSQRRVIPSNYNRMVLSSYKSKKVLVIGLDKLGGSKRCLTNTGVNVRSIPPI